MGCGSSTPAVSRNETEVTHVNYAVTDNNNGTAKKQEGEGGTVNQASKQSVKHSNEPAASTPASAPTSPPVSRTAVAETKAKLEAEALAKKQRDAEVAIAAREAEEAEAEAEKIRQQKRAEQEAAAAAEAERKKREKEEEEAKAAALKQKLEAEAAKAAADEKKRVEEAQKAAAEKAKKEAEAVAAAALKRKKEEEAVAAAKQEALKASTQVNSAAPATHTSAEPSKPVLSSEIAKCDESLLFVLRVDLPVPAAELAVVHEMQKPGNIVRINDPNGPGKLDARTAVLSWRWDIAKPATLEEAKELPPSEKVIAAIEKAREMGHKWLWLDWATVPQYGASVAEILNHVRASRFVYEQCSVILVDLVEISPGLFVPTPDYVSRLWTTAEMSSMLANPNVNYGTFVQFRRWHWQNLILATSASFSATMVRQHFVKEYKDFFARYVTDGKTNSYPITQGGLHMLCYNTGNVHLNKKYGPRLTAWLASNFGKIAEQNTPSPLKLEEEERLIAEFERDCDWDARKSPYCKGLFEIVNKSKRMPDSFDHSVHYKGFLLLATECMRYLLKHWQWNAGAYKSVLQRLGQEFPGSVKLAANDPNNLQCFLESDVDKVREMIMAARGRVKFPMVVVGVEHIPVPLKQWLSVSYPLPNSITVPNGETSPRLGHVMRQSTMVAKPSLNDDECPLRHVDVSLTWVTSGVENTPASRQTIHSNIFVPQTVIRFTADYHSQASKQNLGPASVNVESNAQWIVAFSEKTRLGTDLQEGEFWINLRMSYTPGNMQQKSLSLFRKVKGAVTATNLGDLIDAFDGWVLAEFGKLLTDDDRTTFLADADGKNQAVLEAMTKKSGFAIGAPIVDTKVVEVDDRPDYAPEDVALMAELARKKQEKLDMLLAMPYVKEHGFVQSTLAIMPLKMIEDLLKTAQEAEARKK